MEQCLCRLEPNRLNRIVRFLRGVDHIPVRYGLRLRTQGAGRLKSLGRRRVTLEWCRASNGGSDTGWAGKRPQDDPPGAVSFYSTGVCGKSHSTNPRGRVRLST